MKNVFFKVTALLLPILGNCGFWWTSPNFDAQLQKAVEESDLSSATTALEKAADLNALYEGKTLLYRAIEKGDLAMVTLLLQHGADPNKGEHKPLDFAVVKNNTALAVELIEAGALVDAPLIEVALKKKNAELIERLVRAEGTFTLNGLLHKALKKPSLKVVRALCAAGASIDEKNESGETPLAFYTRLGGHNREILSLLGFKEEPAPAQEEESVVEETPPAPSQPPKGYRQKRRERFERIREKRRERMAQLER